MCSISGFIRWGESFNHEVATKVLVGILRRSAERGNDSFGVVAVQADGTTREYKEVSPQGYAAIASIIDANTVSVIANNRAEPTTEWVENKSLRDVQPFGYMSKKTVLQPGAIWVTHNGTIANDKELAKEFKLHRTTQIDSAVIPPLVDVLGVRDAISALIGSYALAVVRSDFPNRLWLATNYKPLFTQLTDSTLWFGSHPSYVQPQGGPRHQMASYPIVPVEPYTMWCIDATQHRIEYIDLEPRGEKKKALVICSGGLDSVTTAAWAKEQGYEITLLHFTYNCRAQEREIQAVREVAVSLECKYRFEDLAWLGALGGNPLVDTAMPIARGDSGAEFAHEWVPARNMVFIALAAALCDRYEFDTLFLGLNLEEGGAYPDNTVAFVDAMDHACNIGTKSRPRILSPLANKVKHEIVKLGLSLDAPLEHSYSCYHEDGHCRGDSSTFCGPCRMRYVAFQMNGISDGVIREQYMR